MIAILNGDKMTSTREVNNIVSAVWDGSLPVEIRLSASECCVYDQADPYIVCRPTLFDVQAS